MSFLYYLNMYNATKNLKPKGIVSGFEKFMPFNETHDNFHQKLPHSFEIDVKISKGYSSNKDNQGQEKYNNEVLLIYAINIFDKRGNYIKM